MHIFALDFDGVLCDSVREAGVTAWRAGRDFFHQDQAWEPPHAYLHRFTRLRPLVETGYQTLLLMGLIQKGLSDADIATRFSEQCQHLLSEWEVSASDCAERFGAARDAWMAADLDDWLGRQRPYPGVIDTFTAALARHPVFIVTTKQERFVAALLKGWGLSFAPEHIFGLERDKPKERVLAELSQQARWRDGCWHFVEDRLATLERVAAHKALEPIKLYLADWGYNTAADRARARAHPAITVWNPQSFLVVQQ